MPGSLLLVATPIGNLEDITLRALRALKEADLIAAEDTRRTARLLNHYGIATRTTSLHEHNERGRIPGLLAQVREGRTIAVVTDAGMPSMSDPGFLVVRAALDEGLPVQVIPGVSAITAALAGSGLPTDRFEFLGFAPARAAQRKSWLAGRVPDTPGTKVLFEAPTRLGGLLADLLEVAGNRYVVVAHELTKVHESWHRGWISDLIGSSGTLPSVGEFVVLVSDLKSAPGTPVPAPDEGEVVRLFYAVTRDRALGRREALDLVARRVGLSKRQAYSIIEKHKISVE